MGKRWNPWSALRERRHIHFELRALPASTGGGFYVPVRGRAGIFIDPRLRRVERRCVLAHELVHDERRGGCDAPYMPPSWRAVVAREENWVDDAVADRLVPSDELAALCASRVEARLEVTAADVADHFDVTPDVAARALLHLKRRLMAYRGPPI